MQGKNKIFFLLFFAVLLNACELMEIEKQVKMADNIGVIKGKVVRETKQQGPIIIHRYFVKNKTYIADSFSRATEGGLYKFDTDPGKYYIAAYVDKNRDGHHQEDEHANYYSIEPGKPEAVVLEPGQILTVPDIVISGPPPELNANIASEYKSKHKIRKIGVPVSLDNPDFNRNYYPMGLWKPYQFLQHIAPGLFLLQDFDTNKIPVLFVHGINGGPLDWQETIASLDKKKYQPWVFYYPSGLKLDLISDYLVQSLSMVQDSFAFKQIFIVAHSMGGLVARSAVKKYLHLYPELAKSIDLLITINSPLLGMESAGFGVKTSPIVLPVWRDLAPDSVFLEKLNQWQVPVEIPYYLIFSYSSGNDSDGVVSLSSQLPLVIQLNANRVIGFKDSHAGILQDQKFHKLFNEILDNHHD